MTWMKAVSTGRYIFFPNVVCFTLEGTTSLKPTGSQGHATATVQKHPKLIHCHSVGIISGHLYQLVRGHVTLSTVESRLIVCTCLVSGWHMLGAIMPIFWMMKMIPSHSLEAFLLLIKNKL
jgi:hypothetical protein